jgi:hypothetical protein
MLPEFIRSSKYCNFVLLAKYYILLKPHLITIVYSKI